MREVFSMAIAFFGKSVALKIVVENLLKKYTTEGDDMGQREACQNAAKEARKALGKAPRARDLLQTDSRLDDWINKEGCLFMSLIFYYLFYNKRLEWFVPNLINELYAICRASGAIDSKDEVQWSPLLAEIHKFFKCKQEFIYEERINDTDGDGVVSSLSEDEPVIGRYNVKDAAYHFVVVYDDKIKYNPDPEANLDKFNRYDKLDKKI